ncbi:RHS repeat-associated core domain-containing protein [Pseudomonas sp. Irchel 3E13]|uniref:RHS repeat-associated core domain-containing protein n=1 Tax=Pseudomonas sp. Irchel 3E13 TaxID=2008975 RepID=UPI000BA2BF8B|nr:RHS repeat-associated core domain-containing protein [Pseudomonas sp. Irchel 3E13]
MTRSLHQHTPSLTVVDPRGLSVRTIAYYRQTVEDVVAKRVHRQVFNVNGHLHQQWDPRLLALREVQAGVQPNQAMLCSLSGQVLQTESVDAGWRLVCNDAAGLPRESWDGRETHRRHDYDELMRPLKVFEQCPQDVVEHCVERFTYAGASEEDARDNRCGQLIRHDDPAGSLWHERFGLAAQPLTETRRFCKSLTLPRWPESEADLEDTPYTTRWRHDALGAVVEQTDALEHVRRFKVNVLGQTCASWLDAVAVLKHTTYNASGQIEIEQAGNDAITTACYSPVDGLLCSLKTQGAGGKTLQDLHYQFDPAGNIQRIEDLAQPVQWFARQRIQAVSLYTYDTLYQLTSATGRESASQTVGPGLPELELFGTVDDSRWRNYSQTYTYDCAGNLIRLKHDAGAGNAYVRDMVVDERSNRAVFKEGAPMDFAKAFDAHGNQQALAPGQVMHWDSRNQLRQVTQVQRDEPGGQDDDVETYVYDSSGRRVRKVRRSKTRSGEQVSEVRYLPGLEIHTRTAGEQLHMVIAEAGRNDVRLLHWEGGRPKKVDNDQWRYSLSDHLGSATLELGQAGELISQESYYPYGGTAWWAAKSAIEAKYKTVRYSGKERDASGLYYYGLRYYAPWLSRWINPDPAGVIDGLNLFCMVLNNPISYTDTDGRMLRSVNQPTTKKENQPDLNTQSGSSTVIPFPSVTRPATEAAAPGGSSESRAVDFFRVDLAPPSEVLARGFRGNDTERVLKAFGDDTIFVAQDLEGIDAFRAEISGKNLFGDARKYYFEMKMIGGYAREVQKPLHLYKISLPAEHPHYVLSTAVSEKGFVETAFEATNKKGVVAEIKAISEALYQYNIEAYRATLEDYAQNYNATKEVQVKGPILPAFITHITATEEAFMRRTAVTPKRAGAM